MSDKWPEHTTGSIAARENREAMQRQAQRSFAAPTLLACPECHSPPIRVRLNFLAPDKQSMHYRIEIGCVSIRCKLYGRTFPESVWQRQANDQAH